MEQMFITPIRSLDSIGDIGAAKKVVSGQNGGSAFSDIFKEAVQNVKTTEAD